MKSLRFTGLLPFPLRWAQVWERLFPAGHVCAEQPSPAPRVHVVRLGAAGTAYPAALREEPRRHRGARGN